MKMRPMTVCAAVAMLSSSVVNAADSDIVVSHSKIGEGGVPYVGISLGSADYDKANDSSPSLSIFGGIALNELLAIELGVADFGDVGVAPSKSEASAIHGSVVANIGISNELAAYAQVGLASWDYDRAGGNDSSVDVFWGAGLNYEIGRGLAARFALQQFSIDANIATVAVDEDILNASFGLMYRF